MKKLPKIFVLIVIYVSLFFLFGELYVRLACKHKAINEMDIKKYRRRSETYHHEFIPNGKGRLYTKEFKTIYKINSLGIRDKEYSLTKPQNTFRILVLGDSFTEGYGVNAKDTFSDKLEVLLNKNKPINSSFEILNFGCASYSPLLEYILLKKKAIKFNPDLVIILLDLSDFKDDMEYTPFIKFDPEGRPDALPNPGPSIADSILEKSKNPLISFLFNHSVFCNYLGIKINKKLSSSDDNIKEEHPMQTGDIKTDRFWMFRDKISLYDNEYKTYKMVDNTEEKRIEAMDLSFKYLEMINELLRNAGADFLLLIYPYGYQISSEEWSEGRVFFGLEQDKVYEDFHMLESAMKSLARRSGIRLLSLYPYFKNSKIKPLYLKLDGHFNSNGHQVVAEGIFDYLNQNYFNKSTVDN